VTTGNHLVEQLAFVAHGGIGLRDDEVAFFNRRQVIDVAGCHAFDHFTVRCFQETVGIGARVNRQ